MADYTKEEFMNYVALDDHQTEMLKDVFSVASQHNKMLETMSDPITLEIVEKVEKESGILMPEDYKWFLTNVGVVHSKARCAIFVYDIENPHYEKVPADDIENCLYALNRFKKSTSNEDFLSWFKAQIYDTYESVCKIKKLPTEIKVSKPERIRVGGRKIHKIVSLEQKLIEMYTKWYEKKYGEEPELANGKFTQLDDVDCFLNAVIDGMQMQGKDLSKVVFFTENVDFDIKNARNDEERTFLGFHKLPNGVEFLGLAACGDWEGSLWFILYHDGNKLRGYIPLNGNTYNTEFNTAFGSEGDTEKENAPFDDYFADVDNIDDINVIWVWAKRKGYLPMDAPEYYFDILPDFELMVQDIVSRMEVVSDE